MKKVFECVFMVSLMSGAVLHFAKAQNADDPERHWFNYGARASAFAGAYTTQTQDVSSMYWNPASLSFLERNAVLWDYFQEPHGRMKSELLAVPLPFGEENAAGLGINATQILMDDGFGIEHTSALYGFDFASAAALTSTFSVGIKGTVQYGQLQKQQLWTASSAIGILYAPGPDVSYGLVYSGFGEAIQYSLDHEDLVLRHQATPHNLQLGLAMQFPSSKVERAVTIALANDKTFGKTGLRYNGAIEWSATHFLDLRIGYVVAPAYAGAKYGIGIHTDGIQLDYAISPSALTDQFQEVTMSVLM